VVKDGAGVTLGGVSAVTKETTGVYKATIPARTLLDVLDVAWTVQVASATRVVRQKVTVTGERLAPLWMLREDDEMKDLSASSINRLSDVVETWFRRALHFPPVLEPNRQEWEAPACRDLLIPDVFYPQTIHSLVWSKGTTAEIEVDLSTVSIVRGALQRLPNLTFLAGTYPAPDWLGGWYTVYCEHGLTDPPDDLRRAAATFARYVSRTNNYPERATRVVSAETEITFSMPRPDRPTGLPEVDAVVADLAIPFV
jgi:hypothetical protein